MSFTYGEIIYKLQKGDTMFRYADEASPRGSVGYLEELFPTYAMYVKLLQCFDLNNNACNMYNIASRRYFKLIRFNGRGNQIADAINNSFCGQSISECRCQSTNSYNNTVHNLNSLLENMWVGNTYEFEPMAAVEGVATIYKVTKKNDGYGASVFIVSDSSAMQTRSREVRRVAYSCHAQLLYDYFASMNEWSEELTLALQPEHNFTYTNETLQFVLNPAVATMASAYIEQLEAIEAERERKEREERQAAFEQKKQEFISKSESSANSVRFGNTTELMLHDIAKEITQLQSYISDYKRKVEEYNIKLAAKQNEYNSYCFKAAEDEVSLWESIKPYVGVDKFTKAVFYNPDYPYQFRLSCIAPITMWEDDEIVNWKNHSNLPILSAVTSRKYSLITSADIIVKTTGRIDASEIRSSVLYAYTDDNNLYYPTPHPHLARYSCFGNNQDTIEENIRTRKFDVAMAIISQCIHQLNLTDGCVCNTMCDQIRRNHTIKCFLNNETGTYCSWDDIKAEFGGQ